MLALRPALSSHLHISRKQTSDKRRSARLGIRIHTMNHPFAPDMTSSRVDNRPIAMAMAPAIPDASLQLNSQICPDSQTQEINHTCPPGPTSTSDLKRKASAIEPVAKKIKISVGLPVDLQA
jgi:hypothetical protein